MRDFWAVWTFDYLRFHERTRHSNALPCLYLLREMAFRYELRVTRELWVALANLFLSLILLVATLYVLHMRRVNAPRLVGHPPSRFFLLFLGLIAVAVILALDMALSRFGSWGEIGFRASVVVITLFLVALYRQRINRVLKDQKERQHDKG